MELGSMNALTLMHLTNAQFLRLEYHINFSFKMLFFFCIRHKFLFQYKSCIQGIRFHLQSIPSFNVCAK